MANWSQNKAGSWLQVRHAVLAICEKPASYLLDLINDLSLDPDAFERFIACVCCDSFFQYGEGYFVHMPASLVEDYRFNGAVEISWDQFDGQERIQSIPLDTFVLCMKIIILYYASSINTTYQPWNRIDMLDRILKKHKDVST
ncbi:hypothetical protein [Yoonia sp. I 8.24]|uniref:hypothetical protein n=1 Tax=Yoonia sp. I 8.24 TaxID=1537229 RepID=UPI001EDD3880|nr:hypothetical protein [Yoonia sp. I 8.24]MCG3266588.1 hypothetical protein [Yoonia sp. I 8.24]